MGLLGNPGNEFLCVNMVTVGMFLIVPFVSGTLDTCNKPATLFITAPKTMEALSGSCLQIPCNFTPKEEQKFNSPRKIFGVWIKNDSRYAQNFNNVIFNSSGAVSKYPLSITGNLRQKNCTTLFSNLTTRHTDTYYFRVESEPFKVTASCDPLQITVKDSPWRPRIEIPDDLRENQSVTITCSAFTPCPHSPPKLTWNLQQDSLNQIVENKDGMFTTKIQQTITLSDTHDGNNISCFARYPVNEGKDTKTAETERTLNVSYTPRDTSLLISPTGAVSLGSMVNLTCSCRANPPVDHYVWFMTTDGRLEMIKDDSQVYGFEVTNSDRDRLFYCGCRNHLDIQLSKGCQLLFEGDEHLRKLVRVYIVIKPLGIIMLVSTLIIFECWFRLRHSNNPEPESCQMSRVTSTS